MPEITNITTYNNSTNSQNTDALKDFGKKFVNSALNSLFTKEETEPKEEVELQDEEMSLAESFYEECFVKPTSEVIIKNTKSYLHSILDKMEES